MRSGLDCWRPISKSHGPCFGNVLHAIGGWEQSDSPGFSRYYRLWEKPIMDLRSPLHEWWQRRKAREQVKNEGWLPAARTCLKSPDSPAVSVRSPAARGAFSENEAPNRRVPHAVGPFAGGSCL